MTPEQVLLAVAIDAAALALLAAGTLIAVRSRERPSALPFAAVLGTLTLWALFSLTSELSGPLPLAPVSPVWEFGTLACGLLLPGVWVVYALGYAGRGTGLTRRRILLLLGIVIPVVVTGVVIAVDPTRETIEGSVIGLVIVELSYLFGLVVYATYLLVGLYRNHARISRLHVAVLWVGVTGPYLGGLIGDGGVPLDGVSVGLLVSGGLLVGSIRRYPTMTGFPKTDYVAREHVVEDLRDAVFVVDWDGHVLDANETAGRLFGRDPAAAVGTPVTEVVDGLHGRDLSPGTTGTTTLSTTRGRRRVQFSVSAVGEDGDGDGDNPVARAVLLRDVTDQQTREQRLTVLNRVLRHNLRNELDVVLAYADRIDDAETRTAIRDRVDEVVGLGKKARDAEEIMAARSDPPATVDLVAVATDVVEEHRSTDDAAAIDLHCPDELVLTTHRSVLERVLSELVENALEHADSDAPHVEVTVSERAGGAELVVADDGPGIPERERQLIADGTETQLDHGSGLGLWLVNWGVTGLGGDLSFAESAAGGSAVTVRLSDAGGPPRPDGE